MINNTIGPVLRLGQYVKCKKEGWLYKVVEIIPAVEGLTLERYRLEIADTGALRSCSLQDVIARCYLLERYRIVKQQKCAA